RRSWLEMAWGVISTAAARSVTHSSPARASAWSRRRRLSLASTWNRATISVAWSGVSSGRSWIGGLPGTSAIRSEQVLSHVFILSYIIKRCRVLVYYPRLSHRRKYLWGLSTRKTKQSLITTQGGK